MSSKSHFGASNAHFKHGHARGHAPSKTFLSWAGMIQRCTDPNCAAYPNYGGRGITVCPAWLNSFSAFLADMGERPPGLTLGRHPNNDGNYEPGNCRWETRTQQNRNSRNCVFHTVSGITACVSELCEHFGKNPERVHERLLRGWTIERAMFTPIRLGRYRRRNTHQSD